MAERVGNEYVYGGQFSAEDINQGCDCSALVAFILNGVLYGPRATWRRVDGATGAWITTESWRPVEVGEVGPFGTICVASPADIPADAIVRIALHHGPGGGAASHTWCEVAGHRFESNGSRGCVTDPEALRIDAPYANDWAYLPGPLWEPNNETAPPAGGEPTNAEAPYRLGIGDTGLAVIALQVGLNRVFPSYAPPVTGVFDPATFDAVSQFQTRTLSVVTGIVDASTRDLLTHYGIVLTPDTSSAVQQVPVDVPPVVHPPEPPAVLPAPDPAQTVINYLPEAEHQDDRPEHHAILDNIVTALGALAAMLDNRPH